MSRFSGSREQQQAAGARAAVTARNGRRQSQALQRYLELQKREPALTSTVPPTSGEAPMAAWPRLRHGRRTGAVTHEHVVINGRDVEVTEDDIGVTELHLE